jgi:[protein-PII] uridylyltransferase
MKIVDHHGNLRTQAANAPAMGTSIQSSGQRAARRPLRVPKAVGPQLNRTSLAAHKVFDAQRLRLYRAMTNLTDWVVSSEELGVHFASMPMRYWARVDGATLRWHLEMIHEFFVQLADMDLAVTAPVVRWRHFPDRGITEVAVCTWDRLGLLAKVAGSLTAVGLNIVRADVYTRADNVVLDLFEVCNGSFGHVDDDLALVHVARLLTAALSPGSQLGFEVRRPPNAAKAEHTPTVTFDNERSEAYTVLQVEAADRLGLLYDILDVLARSDVDIAHAIIVTDRGEAGDVFYLTGTDGRKIGDTDRLRQLHNRLLEVLG